jgi:hypothetical protein
MCVCAWCCISSTTIHPTSPSCTTILSLILCHSQLSMPASLLPVARSSLTVRIIWRNDLEDGLVGAVQGQVLGMSPGHLHTIKLLLWCHLATQKCCHLRTVVYLSISCPSCYHYHDTSINIAQRYFWLKRPPTLFFNYPLQFCMQVTFLCAFISGFWGFIMKAARSRVVVKHHQFQSGLKRKKWSSALEANHT